MDYKKKVIESIEQEFEDYKKKIISLSPEKVFDRSDDTACYMQFRDFICYCDELNEEHYQEMYKRRGHILSSLHCNYQNYENLEEMYEFVSEYFELKEIVD